MTQTGMTIASIGRLPYQVIATGIVTQIFLFAEYIEHFTTARNSGEEPIIKKYNNLRI